MDDILMRWGSQGFCPDCADDRILLPADEHGFEFCCSDCDAAVLLLDLACSPVDTVVRRAS
jgi:hypothetical protein